MTSLSSARQSEVKAWEEEIVPCEHTLTLQQEALNPIPASGAITLLYTLRKLVINICHTLDLAHCRACDLKENLWLCMTCGSLGCGRQLYGGLGGNGHGLQHFNESGHPISVKLGTITPDRGAGAILFHITKFIVNVLLFARHILLHL